jgi:hypothetical protein
MFQTYLTVFRQLFICLNCSTALILKLKYSSVTAFSPFTSKYICLITSLFTFSCAVRVFLISAWWWYLMLPHRCFCQVMSLYWKNTNFNWCYWAVGLEVNAEKTKYTLLSRHQNARQNHDTEVLNKRFEDVAQFKYLGMTVTNQNLIQEEITRRVNSDNACYHLL